MRKILFLITTLTLILTLTSCNKPNWNDETNMGDISVDDNDTEYLGSEVSKVKSDEDDEDIDMLDLVKAEKNDTYSIVPHFCSYHADSKMVILQGAIHIFDGNNDKKISIRLYNSQNQVVGESSISTSGDSDVAFAIDSPINDGFTAKDVTLISVFAE